MEPSSKVNVDTSVAGTIQRYLALESSKRKSLLSEKERLKSFASWNVEFVDKNILAMQGFHFLRPPDAVECVFCELILSNWKPGINTFSDHFRLNSNCPMLRLRAYNNIPINSEKLTNEIISVLYGPKDSKTTGDDKVSDQYIYTQYKEESDRLKTYSKWSYNFAKGPIELSNAGFFHTGINDKVTCFSCGKSTRGLKEDDNIWEMHDYNENNCEYVRIKKGQEFIDTVKTKGNDLTLKKTQMDSIKLENCKHPNYWNKSERMKTFQNWSYDFKKSPQELCEAGFFSTGNHDEVICFSCDGKIKSWKENDCVWEAHALKYANCEYLKALKGQIFIDSVKANKNAANQMNSNLSPSDMCKHPKYWSKSERIKSFYNWSVAFKQNPEELSEAGFFYKGHTDEVTCFHCGGSIQNWKETVCAFKEHIRQYPNCKYVKEIKGQSFIDSVKRDFDNNISDFGDVQEITNKKLLVSNAKHPDYWHRVDRLKTFQNWSFKEIKTPEELSEAGYFCLNVNDSACCFYCGQVTHRWTNRSCVWKIHSRNSGYSCEFVRAVKGQDFMDSVRMSGNVYKW